MISTYTWLLFETKTNSIFLQCYSIIHKKMSLWLGITVINKI